jgi:phosphoribosylaminoimidazole-succinocarboxamide synthase
MADLRANAPVIHGSVQNIYRWHHDGRDYLVSEASDAGSAFDVGTFFEIPGSGQSRTELRHAVFRRLASAAAWQALTRADVDACCSGTVAERRWSDARLQRLCAEGAATHHVGVVDEATGEVTDGAVRSRIVLVEAFPVIRPVHFTRLGRSAWDYHRYQIADRKLVDLEHIFRLGSPAGSSIEQRYRKAVQSGNAAAAEQLLRGLGLDKPIVAWGKFDDMLYDCSTKYEDHDRYLGWQEAVHVSGVDHDVFDTVIELLAFCTIMVNRVFAELGFILWDMKWEAAVDGAEVVVVDTVDHDSIRITSDELVDGRRCYTHFNKQAVRDYYRILHPEWVAALDDAKARAEADPTARTFMSVYEEGVALRQYPPIPPLDPDFAAIQTRKYDKVAGGASGRLPIDADGGIRAIVEDEVRYYAGRGRGDEFLSHISA